MSPCYSPRHSKAKSGPRSRCGAIAGGNTRKRLKDSVPILVSDMYAEIGHAQFPHASIDANVHDHRFAATRILHGVIKDVKDQYLKQLSVDLYLVIGWRNSICVLDADFPKIGERSDRLDGLQYQRV
jgi:hypothetical protein